METNDIQGNEHDNMVMFIWMLVGTVAVTTATILWILR
jgi:hypothetical protein